MQSNSITVTLARVAKRIRNHHEGRITYSELLHVVHEYGVHQDAAKSIDKLVVWKWLQYDHIQDMYYLTPESTQTATITITVPRLLAKEAYNDIVERYGRYSGIIVVGEVRNDD